MKRACSPLFLGVLMSVCPLVPGQDEIGKKERARIKIEWSQEDSKNFAIEFENVIARSTVKRIASELEDSLTQYILVFRFKPAEKLKVRFLDSQNTYEQEGGKPSTAGHYIPGTGYLVLKQLPFPDLIPTAYHEAFHQYLHYYIGKDVEIPIWFNEGMASYYEQMRREPGTKKLSYKLIDNRGLRMMQAKLVTRSTIPFAKLVDMQYEEFHDKADKQREDMNYSQSFAMIYFFMKGLGGKPVFQFTEELKKTKNADAAMEKIFGKERKNLQAMEDRWKAFVTQEKILELKPAPF